MTGVAASKLLTTRGERWQLRPKDGQADLRPVWRLTREGKLDGAVVRLGAKTYRYRLPGPEEFERQGGITEDGDG